MSRAGSLWRQRDFVLLWGSQTTSSLGNEISYLALPLVAGLVLDASPVELGLLTAARRLPVLFASLPAGALSDRWRKRPVMIVAFLVSGCAMGTVPLAAAAGGLTLGQLYAVALVVATCEVFFTPAYQTYPLTLLGPERLMEGNAKLTSTVTVAGMAGQPIGGVLISLFGPAKAVLADALSYLVGALALALIRSPEARPERKERAPRLREQIAEGLRYVVRHRVIGPLVLYMATVSFCIAGLSALEVNYVVRELGWSGLATGLVFGVSMAGGLAAGAIGGPLTERYGMPRVLLGAAFAYPLCSGSIGLVGPGLAGQLVVGVSWTLMIIVTLVFQSTQRSLRQLLTPKEMQGRLAATSRWLTWAATPVGAVLAGALAAGIGMRGTLVVFSAGMLAGPVVMWCSPLRTSRREIERDVRTATAG
ncbi:MFS transporter [Nonomuraea sp. NPDC050227]|uniref:MFS transporter n=1 Tax=Nonomuraea sp. NPDC050227 TaxID=3364360 RepID=UPI0037AF9E6E